MLDKIDIAIEYFEKSLKLKYTYGLKICYINNKIELILEEDRHNTNYDILYIFYNIPKKKSLFKQILHLFMTYYPVDKDYARDILESTYQFKDEIYYYGK